MYVNMYIKPSAGSPPPHPKTLRRAAIPSPGPRQKTPSELSPKHCAGALGLDGTNKLHKTVLQACTHAFHFARNLSARRSIHI